MTSRSDWEIERLQDLYENCYLMVANALMGGDLHKIRTDKELFEDISEYADAMYEEIAENWGLIRETYEPEQTDDNTH